MVGEIGEFKESGVLPSGHYSMVNTATRALLIGFVMCFAVAATVAQDVGKQAADRKFNAGIMAYKSGHFDQALRYWETALAMYERIPGTERERAICQDHIRKVRRAFGQDQVSRRRDAPKAVDPIESRTPDTRPASPTLDTPLPERRPGSKQPPMTASHVPTSLTQSERRVREGTEFKAGVRGCLGISTAKGWPRGQEEQ